MKNAILFGRVGKVTKKTMGLFLFFFALISVGNISAQCSLVAEEQISASVDENCEAAVTVDAVLDGTMTSCPGGDFLVFLYDAEGTLITTGAPAIIPAGYVGESLTAVVEDIISGNRSNDCIVDVFDMLKPEITCYEPLEVSEELSLTVADLTYNRSDDPFPCVTSGVGTDVPYHELVFQVSADGTYNIELLPGAAVPVDGYYAALFETTFDPMDPCTNAVSVASGAAPVLMESLVAGTDYILVTSSVTNAQYGDYSYAFTSADGEVLLPVPNCEFEVYCYEDIDERVVLIAEDNCDALVNVEVVGEVTNENDCISGWDDNIFRVINRTYRATDDSDNQSDDLDVVITVVKMTDVEFQTSVVEPADLLVVTDNAINCHDTYDTNLYGNPDPSFSGVPTLDIDGEIISLETPYMACNITATYVDLGYSIDDDCIQQFSRMWTVTQWSCQNPNNVVYPPFLQTIEIADTTAPVVICPDNEVVNTNTLGEFDDTSFGTVNCGSDYDFPIPVVTDNCQDELKWDIQVLNDSGVPVVFLDDVSLISSTSWTLPLGVNTVIYRVYDGCNNLAECEFLVDVQDQTPPVAICQTFTTVALTYDGEAEVPATSFDSGSWDDCQMGDILVRRMEDDPDTYYDFITFDCNDIGNDNLMVVMRVYDIFENWSECMVSVIVQDKLNPIIECPDNMEVDCDFYFEEDNLTAYFGWPVAYDNCSVTVTTDSIIEIDQCGEGTITRTFTATDPDGRTDECEQIISFVNNNHFACGPDNIYDPDNNYGDIEWPADVLDIEGCLDPNNFDSSSPLHPNQSGFPILHEDQCDMAGPSIYSDEIYVINDNELDSPGACFKVIRTWKVTDWCNRVNGVYATWEHDQVLMVNNYVAPVFSRIIPDTTTCTFDETCTDGYIELIMTATDGDDCTEDEDLKWQYKIDYFNDGGVNNYDFESPIFNGNNLDASNDYEIGTHRILWTVWDQCGNLEQQEHLFTIQNCKRPTPICLVGLAVDLTQMPSGPAAMIQAEFFNDNSYHTCNYPLSYSFSADVNDTLRTYGCDDEGIQDVEMWVTAYLPDGSITQDFCATTIDVQDQFDLCPDNLPMVYVTGGITDEFNNPVTSVKVALQGSEFTDQLTDETGSFAFPEMVGGGSYTVKPGLDENHGNGVSTLDLIHVQKHLLGLKTIDSPYKMIAADVNRDSKISASDLLDARELILGVSDIFENNTSWRFIRADYEFTNEANPLTETYPEFEEIVNIQEDKVTDFVAIKVGDITNDADLDGNPELEGRNATTLILDVDNNTFRSGENVEVPVFASDFNQINGFQFTLNYDVDALQFNGIDGGVLNMGIANYFENEEGTVNVSWSRAIAIDVEDEAVLFTISFDATDRTTLDEAVQFNSAGTKAEAYNADLEKMNLDLNFRNLESDLEYVLYQNTPNPFSDNTNIQFQMKNAGQVQIAVYDLNGKVLKVIEGLYEKGIHHITLNKYDLPVNGMLYYQMNTDGFTATKKMILVK